MMSTWLLQMAMNGLSKSRSSAIWPVARRRLRWGARWMPRLTVSLRIGVILGGGAEFVVRVQYTIRWRWRHAAESSGGRCGTAHRRWGGRYPNRVLSPRSGVGSGVACFRGPVRHTLPPQAVGGRESMAHPQDHPKRSNETALGAGTTER